MLSDDDLEVRENYRLPDYPSKSTPSLYLDLERHINGVDLGGLYCSWQNYGQDVPSRIIKYLPKSFHLQVQDPATCATWLETIDLGLTSMPRAASITHFTIHNTPSSVPSHQRPRVHQWCHLFSILRRDAVNIKSLVVTFDHELGKDLDFIHGLVTLTVKEVIIFTGYYAMHWPRFVEEMMGLRPVNLPYTTGSWERRLRKYHEDTKTICPWTEVPLDLYESQRCDPAAFAPFASYTGGNLHDYGKEYLHCPPPMPSVPTLMFGNGFVMNSFQEARGYSLYERYRTFGASDFSPFRIHVIEPDTLMTWLAETEKESHAFNAASITHLFLYPNTKHNPDPQRWCELLGKIQQVACNIKHLAVRWTTELVRRHIGVKEFYYEQRGMGKDVDFVRCLAKLKV